MKNRISRILIGCLLCVSLLISNIYFVFADSSYQQYFTSGLPNSTISWTDDTYTISNSGSSNSSSSQSNSSDNTVSGSSTSGDLVSTGYKVTIESPTGAEVYVDGNYVGIVPISFAKKSGSHEVTVRKSGYMTRTYTIDVDNEAKDISYSFSDLTPIE